MSLFRWSDAEREEREVERALIEELRQRQQELLDRLPDASVKALQVVPDHVQRLELKRKLERLLTTMEQEEHP